MRLLALLRSYIIFVGYSMAALTFRTIEVGNSIRTATSETSDGGTLINVINQVNTYLRIAIGFVSLVVLVYGGFKLISSQGDDKKLKETNNLILGAFIGIAIASMGYAIVRIIINLF